VAAGETAFVSTIPAGKDKIYIQLSATAGMMIDFLVCFSKFSHIFLKYHILWLDLDTKLVAGDGTTVLIQYLDGWTHGSFQSASAIPFAYHGMGFLSCVDSCTEDITLNVNICSTHRTFFVLFFFAASLRLSLLRLV
jgi:hypothetical protein